MTELLITYAQFLGASALLVTFYWVVLRHRASYKLSRLYLIGVPMLSAMMCGVKFEVELPAMPFLTETEAMTSKITPALIINEPQYNSITETVSAPESSSAIEVPMIKEPQAEKSQVNIDFAAIIRIIVPLISVILLLIAAFHIISGIDTMTRGAMSHFIVNVPISATITNSVEISDMTSFRGVFVLRSR